MAVLVGVSTAVIKHSGQTQFREAALYFSSHCQVSAHHRRKSEQRVKQKSTRDNGGTLLTGSLPGLCSSSSLLWPRTTCHGMMPPTEIRVSPSQSSMEQCLIDTATQISWIKTILRLRFALPGVFRLCQVDSKTKSIVYS